MKRLCFLVCALFAASSVRAEFYYTIMGAYARADGVHYKTPDAACQVAFPQLQAKLASIGYTVPSPYTGPVLLYETPPNTAEYDCPATATFVASPTLSATATFDEYITKAGNNCTDQQTYNPDTGACENSDEDQDRKEQGDLDSPQATGGVLICKAVGDPINAATGNLFESETDYQDPDGELHFVLYYNSASGQWHHSYDTSLRIDSDVMALHFEDGHTSLFMVNNGVATAEPTELGRLEQVSGQWVYTSPSNEEFVFDAMGRLVIDRQPNGLAKTFTYTLNSDYTTTVTATDSRGHTMTWINGFSGGPSQMTVGDLTVTYTWVESGTQIFYSELTQAVVNRSGHISSRTYTYGDARNTSWLTGITDERGVVYSTWTYDDQGRATSSQHAGGADQTALTYNSDGTTTVTNALGHSVTFTYQVIQGVKRITHIAGQPTASCPASDSSYTYTPDGQVQTMTDALGHVTAYTYDTLGREISRVEAQGTPQQRTTTTTWNATWPYLRESVTREDRVTTYGYDNQGRLTSTTVHDNKE